MSSFTLQEYRIQREYRQNKRKQFLKRFELLKQKMPFNVNQVPTNINKTSRVMNNSHLMNQKQPSGLNPNPSTTRSVQKPLSPSPVQQPSQTSQPFAPSQQLTTSHHQNILLKQQLQLIQTQQRKKLLQFKNQISSIKQKYIEQIKSISALAQKNKVQNDEKMKKIMTQIENTIKKNQEIEKMNEQIKKDLGENNTMMEGYTTEIKNEYSKKLIEFEKIFNSSNQKIEQMQRDFNQDEFVQNALKNQQLLLNIQQNANKSQQAIQILSDYRELLNGKSQILVQLTSNIEMKQSQLQKMNQLQGKIKVIFEKMNQQKKGLVEENQRITKELLEIKGLIQGFMSKAEQQGEEEA